MITRTNIVSRLISLLSQARIILNNKKARNDIWLFYKQIKLILSYIMI